MEAAARLGEVTAVILAGGLGTRLRPVVDDRPKFLAPVAGRPVGARILDGLAAAGLRRAVLCTGYLAEQIEAHFGDRHGALALRYSRERAPAGTGGALRGALDLIDSDPALVLNGDSLGQLDYAALWDWYRPTGGSAIVVAPVADVSAYGGVRIGPGDRLAAFVEKASGGPGFVNAGVYLLERARIAAIEPDRPLSLERDLFPAWLSDGLRAYRADGGFLDIGTPERLALAERSYLPKMELDPNEDAVDAHRR